MNVFDCGGIAIGVCISHKILDGAALCTFLKAWTAVAHGSKEKGRCVTKKIRFFMPRNIQPQESNQFVCHKARPLELITALLWKSIMEASEQLHGFRRPCSMTHLVNLRKRMEPTLSDNSLENLLLIANEEHEEESKQKLEDLVTKVRKAISDIDDVFVQKLMTGKEGYGLMSESIYDIIELCSKDGTDSLGFSS
ncbi:hypothetical protein K2173_007451 [Erythroxylum novogranatense]|uniref:Uncharacterized protein n=1 Tax=Erythroxylum novogranatense TaxID=1862640 RepID=A0AAV8T7K9_9ROSI|nr:hypothetical protein K2173_007451 [Erythroxylum novogranatense]